MSTNFPLYLHMLKFKQLNSVHSIISMYSKSAVRAPKAQTNRDIASKINSRVLRPSFRETFTEKESLCGKRQLSIDTQRENLSAEIYVQRNKQVNGSNENDESSQFQTRTSQRMKSMCGLIARRDILEEERRKLNQIFFQEENPKYKVLFAEAYTQVLDQLRFVYAQYNQKFYAQKKKDLKRRA